MTATVLLQPRSWPPERPWSALDPSPQAPPALWLIDRRQDGLNDRRPALLSLLSAEERARLARLLRADDRDRFLLGRGVLRTLLGGLCGLDPSGLALVSGPHGKPRLADSAAGRGACPALEFNLAHSGDLVLLGFHARRPVGVDVEGHRAGLAWEPIARRCLTAEQCAAIAALPPSARQPAFLRHWCRLEAELKARGTGFGAPPEPPGPTQATVTLFDLVLPQGYGGAAALA